MLRRRLTEWGHNALFDEYIYFRIFFVKSYIVLNCFLSGKVVSNDIYFGNVDLLYDYNEDAYLTALFCQSATSRYSNERS